MTIALVALFGVVINGGTAYLFHGHSHHDLNARAVYWHMLVDALVSVSVIVTGFLIWLTGLNWLDTVVSFAIALVIFWTTLGLLRDAFGASMLEVPREIDLEQVIALLRSYPGVEGVRDVHVWSIGTSLVAITAHLIKPGLENEDTLLAKAKEDLHEKFGIEHVTLQIEREALQPQCDAR
jgi:cobalt-zinc-cadmium efflux system protein